MVAKMAVNSRQGGKLSRKLLRANRLPSYFEDYNVRWIMCSSANMRQFSELILLVCVSISANDIRPAFCETTGEHKMNTEKATRDGATVVISVPDKCRVGQKIPLSITIRNDDEHAFSCNELAGRLPNKYMTIALRRRGDNSACEMTAEARELFESIPWGGQFARTRLEKGKQKTWTIDLNSFFVIAPGEMSFSATFKLYTDAPGGHAVEIAIDELPVNVSE